MRIEVPKAGMFTEMVDQAEIQARMDTMQIDWKWRTDKKNVPIFQKWIDSLPQDLSDQIWTRIAHEVTKTGIKDELRTFNPNTILELRILNEDKPYRNFIPQTDWIRNGIEKYLMWDDDKKAIYKDNKEYLQTDDQKWNQLCHDVNMTDEAFEELKAGTIHENNKFWVNMECLMRLHPRITIESLKVFI